jgi:hypothetical protein
MGTRSRGVTREKGGQGGEAPWKGDLSRAAGVVSARGRRHREVCLPASLRTNSRQFPSSHPPIPSSNSLHPNIVKEFLISSETMKRLAFARN